MQEFQSIPGLAGRLFGGAAAAADLRRAQAQQGPAARCGGIPSPEAVKCPRCDSTNTKFCYYNNYNLSQPRHFCKSCRRYWTKGGVLRNVPVGGGCRKSKRSSSSSSSSPSTPTATDAKNQRRASASSQRSNSGSGSTSPSTATATTPTTPPTPSSNTISVMNHATNPFPTDVPPPAPIFADQAAALASLFGPPAPPPLPVFSFAAQPKTGEGIASVLLGAPGTPPAATATTTDMTLFTSLDTGIFELGDMPPAAYWNAGSCWTDVVSDPTVYLP
ncbi:hypothetical protein GUJ93_ZPchr0002g23340 [Zizania palustris]|uniref:Dof zinc finger protein n=1 Tax=Zizania palustris TaxID=103762 RepID=A0A8J5RHA4_ZIZPA|nr:hypothetical protein GUJ93_ZPchr0002g23340 [Zizania palustris]